MNNDPWSGTGSFHPQRAWSGIWRKDWERKHDGGLGWKGSSLLIALLLSIVGTAICAILFVGHSFL